MVGLERRQLACAQPRPMGQVPAWERRPRKHFGSSELMDRRPGPGPEVGTVRRLGSLGPSRRQPGRPVRSGLVGLLGHRPQHG
eukprot:5135004-Alexandrium_andersonii.AAC.1